MEQRVGLTQNKNSEYQGREKVILGGLEPECFHSLSPTFASAYVTPEEHVVTLLHTHLGNKADRAPEN